MCRQEPVLWNPSPEAQLPTLHQYVVPSSTLSVCLREAGQQLIYIIFEADASLHKLPLTATFIKCYWIVSGGVKKCDPGGLKPDFLSSWFLPSLPSHHFLFFLSLCLDDPVTSQQLSFKLDAESEKFSSGPRR